MELVNKFNFNSFTKFVYRASNKLQELLTDHLSNISCKVNLGMLLFAVGVMGQPPPYQPHVSLLCFTLIIARILMKWN